MAEDSETKKVFDAEAAASLMKELRGTYASGKTRSYEWRVAQLKNLMKIVDDHEKDILDAIRADLSKPEQESYIAEISIIKSSCTRALGELNRWMKPEKVKTSITTFPSSAEIVSEPLGVVLIIGAWNFPLLLALDPAIGAIAAGNAVVLKPSELCPATSSLIAKLVGKYLDSSCIKVVEGAVAETSALLEQKWDKIFFTGSGRVGRIVMAAAAKHLTPVALELGGKCPVVVDSDINLPVAIRRIAGGKWASNNGQACIAPDYIVTTKDFAPKLVRLLICMKLVWYLFLCLFHFPLLLLFLQIDALKHELEAWYGKDPLESKDLAHIVNSNHFARLAKLLDDDKVSGKIIHGGQRDKANLKFAPTILLDVPEDSLVMNEEIFGPLLPILTVDKLEDSFDMITSRGKPLAAYLFTNNKKLKEKFVKTVSAGGLVINDTVLHFAEKTLPFGGVGESGMGSYHGKFSYEAFSHRKSVLYRGFAGDASARYPPYSDRKLKLLKALLSGSVVGVILALIGWS
eukprot:XP_010664198.1 PREDICTED: aldehyde dehydrogenase family 3 member H1 isoform X1 [Vitis vinifera]